MYHCQIHFYLSGGQCRAFDLIKEITPYENFTHQFIQSSTPDPAKAAGADVMIANVQGMDAGRAAGQLLSGRKDGAELILILEKDQISALTGYLSQITEIWTAPMTDEELRFRYERWRRVYKQSKDLWQAQHFLEATIDHVPNLVWYKDKQGIHEKVNTSFCRTVGKTRQQVEGRGHAYIWDVEHDDPACIESEQEVMSSGRTCVSEELVQTGAGVRTLMTYKSPLYDLDGSVMGTVGVAIDVTQERVYEQEIIQKNQTLEKIFTTIDCGVIRHTADGSRVLSINRAALKILGYESQAEMEADGFQMVAGTILEEDRERFQACIESLEKEGDSISTEYRIRHKNGEVLHIMGNVKLLKEDGQLFYQRFLLDCTEQKLLEQKRERRQADLVQALTVDYNVVCFYNLNTDKGIPLRRDERDQGAFRADAGGNIFFKESMERYIQQTVHEEDKERLRQFCQVEDLKKKLMEQGVRHVNYRAVTDDGAVQYYQLKAVRTGSWGRQCGIVIGLRSVDEEMRKEMEHKELLETALMQANRASRAKSVFLSNMSHDIRTPMNAIVGFTALAMTHISQRDRVEEYLKKIMTSGNHLLSLINDVLDMSRIESGKMHLDEKPCCLPDILHGLRNILQADIHAKQLELYMDAVDITDEEIYCDKLRLNQVLLNLLGNAVKYTGAGGKISMCIIEKPGREEGCADYEFQIKDTGIGMSEEFVAHIFEPFEREKSSTISGIQGTGLGMAITKNIVDLMNGTISLKSEQGVGTEVTVCFTFRLSGEKASQDIPELKNCRALVIDDDFNTCDSVTYMLGQIGMRAEWTLSGKEALLRTHQAVNREDIYTVYVIDWMLPDMNGIEVTRRIRKEMGDEVPIILLTAYDWSDIEDEAKEAGISAFCSKPLFLSELRGCLHAIVEMDEAHGKESGKETVRQHAGRILLAEDNEINQEIAAAILGDAGFTIEIAGNGQTAVDMLKASGPGYYQLVLMDVQMPVMDGYEATKTIRRMEDPALASIPILAMTANAFEEDRQQALESGMNGHLSKPIDVEALLAALDKVLS